MLLLMVLLVSAIKDIKMSLRGKAEAISKDEIPRYARNDISGTIFDEYYYAFGKLFAHSSLSVNNPLFRKWVKTFNLMN
jgi:hypothetical protein